MAQNIEVNEQKQPIVVSQNAALWLLQEPELDLPGHTLQSSSFPNNVLDYLGNNSFFQSSNSFFDQTSDCLVL